jgi:hypothetical protein
VLASSDDIHGVPVTEYVGRTDVDDALGIIAAASFKVSKYIKVL